MTQYNATFCEGYVTWPVHANLFQTEADYDTADTNARAYYLNNKDATFSDESADGNMNKNLLSYQPYWGCVQVRNKI